MNFHAAVYIWMLVPLSSLDGSTSWFTSIEISFSVYVLVNILFSEFEAFLNMYMVWSNKGLSFLV